MLVVMVIAVVVVLAAVIVAAAGRGGALSVERGAYAPLDLGPVSSTDVALLRPPSGLWGYNVPATDAALEQIAEAIRERDVRIVALEQLVTDLGRDNTPALPLGSPYGGARHRRPPAPDTGLARTDPTGTAPAWTEPPSAVPGHREPAWTELAWTEQGEAGPARDEASAGNEAPTAELAGAEPGQAEPAWSEASDTEPDWVARESGSADAPRLPSKPGRPGGDASGVPPEQSHD